MKVVLESLSQLIDRDLNKLASEIRQYPDEASIWKVEKAISNSAGTLCLHLCGNLQHYIGHVLGGSVYKRNRDLEFSARHVSRDLLLKEIDNARLAVAQTLPNLNPDITEKHYPEKVFEQPMTTLHFLIHLEAHLNYHLGQVNYHRRLLAS
jgi:uncharacterized damage-inducible protein DinB